MTLLAIRPEAALMNVIGGVAGAADHRRLHPVLRSQMAVRTADAGMRTQQGEAGMRSMIEVPLLPAVGTMALGAVLTQCARMRIIAGVTAMTITGCIVEALTQVTLRTADHHVQAGQRIVGQIVIEAYLLPARDGMTLLALSPELAAVRVSGPMAVCAGRAEVLFAGYCAVTGVTVDAGMGALQRVVETPSVIEVRHFPHIIPMAVITARAKAACMAVIGAVAAAAVLGKRCVQITAAMAGRAGDARVTSQKRKAGLVGVIELPR